jgi:hypothetical protein
MRDHSTQESYVSLVTVPKPGSYAGFTTCLRCDDVFDSWDRRRNRLCDRCWAAIAEEPSNEPVYRPFTLRHAPRDE